MKRPLKRLRQAGVLGAMSRAATGNGQPATWVSRGAFVVEAVGVAALAYILAQLVWVAYPPFVDVPLSRAAPLQSTPALASGGVNPFSLRASFAEGPADPLADAPATTLNLQVVGVRSAADGGSAIIQTPDNQQRLYRVGDVIVDGVTLASVESHRIVILRDGQPESVLLTNRPSMITSGGAAPGDGAAEAAAGGPATISSLPAPNAPIEGAPVGGAPVGGRVSAQALLDGVSPSPSAEGGVVVQPRGDGVAFAAAGFQPGDVLLSVNGTPFDPAAWAGSFASVGPGSTLVVEARRAGAPVTIQFILE